MSIILIADSGSTKTDWCLVNENGVKKKFTSKGMNPYNISQENLKTEIETAVLPEINNSKTLNYLYFYGAGCSSNVKQDEMKNTFSLYFLNAHIEIEHDLLGAARATCGREAGICAILGTGSNSCMYDGKNIKENVPALGYVLCDEGAGTNIGKVLLRNYLRHLMPKDIEEQFANQYPGEETDFLNRLYRGEIPNYYLASFAKFAMDNQTHPYLRWIIEEAFETFFKNQILRYSQYNKYPISVVGSVGYLARDIFCNVAQRHGLKVKNIIQAPLDALLEYHSQN
ncbi:MAG: ATPase [Bacteroidales bacterium]|jgi:N-acetylglucosamine kinase-like BadF-type ATPase|nr:ATPase [Bacteroidales bacterium]